MISLARSQQNCLIAATILLQHAWNDYIQKDTLYLCVNKPYEFKLQSRDIIHSAYMPHFCSQMNCVPGIQTRMKFTPNLTTQQMRKK